MWWNLKERINKSPYPLNLLIFFIGNMTSTPQPQGCNSEQLPLCLVGRTSSWVIYRYKRAKGLVTIWDCLWEVKAYYIKVWKANSKPVFIRSIKITLARISSNQQTDHICFDITLNLDMQELYYIKTSQGKKRLSYRPPWTKTS